VQTEVARIKGELLLRPVRKPSEFTKFAGVVAGSIGELSVLVHQHQKGYLSACECHVGASMEGCVCVCLRAAWCPPRPRALSLRPCSIHMALHAAAGDPCAHTHSELAHTHSRVTHATPLCVCVCAVCVCVCVCVCGAHPRTCGAAIYSAKEKDAIEAEVSLTVKTCGQQIERLKNSVVSSSARRDEAGRPVLKPQAVAHLHGMVSGCWCGGDATHDVAVL
jgi:hypothetical protein